MRFRVFRRRRWKVRVPPWLAFAFVAVAVALVGLPDVAAAQGIGGGITGSGGLLQPALTWFGTNLAGGIVMAGVLFVGLGLLVMRMFVGGILMMVVGALVIGNYQTIASALVSGAGAIGLG